MRGRLAATLVLVVVPVVTVGVVVPAASATPSAVGASWDRPAAGLHGNHVAVDTQISADGTVTVETASILVSGFVVLHADDGGRPGEPIGHAPLADPGFRTNVTASVEGSVWRDWGENRTVWAVLHRDDGDGTFEPGEDRSLIDRSPAARARFSLGKADGSVRVLAPVFGAIRTEGTRVTVPAASLSEQGYLAVLPDEGSRPVGTTRLPPGHHTNVSVDLNATFLAEQRARFRVRVTVYRDDGDGLFDAGDAPVTVGGDPVSTAVTLERGNASTTADGSLVNTPTGTPPPTPTPMQTPTQTPSPTPAASDDPTPTDTVPATTAGSGPGGFGALAALTGLLGLLLFARR